MTRDEVALALRMPRATVAFHLDKLVAEGLLEVTFARRTGRAGPGAGRPAKLYRRAGRGGSVSLPERRYELAAHLLDPDRLCAAGVGGREEVFRDAVGAVSPALAAA